MGRQCCGSIPTGRLLSSSTTLCVVDERTVLAADLVDPLAGMTLEDLRTAIEEGWTYANVYTSANPSGEIRGQIH